MAFRPVDPNQPIKPLNPTMDSYMGSEKSPGGGMGGGIGSNPEALQTLLTMGVLSGNLSPSAGTFLQKSYLPPAETSTTLRKKKEARESQQRAYERASRLTNQALGILAKEGKSSGFDLLAPLKKRGILGMKTKDDRALLDAVLGQLSGITAFDEAGKALTATELGIVGGKVPQVGWGESDNATILKQIGLDTESKYKEFMNSVGATPQMDGQGSQNDDPLGLFQ